MNDEQSLPGARPPASLLARFRSDRRRLPLHPREKAVLIAVAVHLCFLPWALGTMRAWSQCVSLGLSAVGFVLALLPRTYSGDNLPPMSPQVSGPSAQRRAPSSQLPAHSFKLPAQSSQLTAHGSAFRLTMWPRLLRFPIFWIGLMLLAYIAVQGFNPSWVYTQNDRQWWLIRVNDIPWLPTSVETPFERFNLWRQFIIYASAWLTVCTVWTGFTRRRSLQLLLITLAVNALALASAGFAQRILAPGTILGLMKSPVSKDHFATFIYHNHAGGYFALLAFVAAALAVWLHDSGERSLKKSTPASLLAFAAVLLAGTVIFTESRGASAVLAFATLLFVVWLWGRQRLQPSALGSNRAVTLAVVLVFGGVLAGTAHELDFSAIYGRFDRLIHEQSREQSAQTRLMAYEAGRLMLADYWQRGVGSGDFRYLFPEYVKNYPVIYESGYLFWEHAHRDWFEIPIELGVAGTLLVLLGATYWLVYFYRRRVLWHSLAVPVLIGCSQALLHAWFDFPFQCPAILITWLALVAISARWLELEAA